jgi:hypothetical protein
MTEKKSAPKKDVNKSEEIRKVATAMKARNEKPRPVKIIEILKKQGIEVSSPQVSMVLKRMGFRPRSRASYGAGSAAGGKSSVNGVTVEDLLAAKKVATRFGGVDKAIRALEALKHFS